MLLYVITNNNINDLCHRLKADDSILLILDGSYLATASDWQAQIPKSVKRFILLNDATARGIQFSSDWTAINYDEWVNLSLQHTATVTW